MSIRIPPPIDASQVLTPQLRELEAARREIERLRSAIRALRREQWIYRECDVYCACALESEPAQALADHRHEYDRHTERLIYAAQAAGGDQ
jgi:hypothetical protein